MRLMDPNDLIDSLGGTAAVARLVGVTPQAVSQWRANGIPRAWVKYLELVSERKLAPMVQGVDKDA